MGFRADGTLGRGNTVFQSTGPCMINCNNFGTSYYSFHSGGANFVFADGSVRFLRDSLTAEMVCSLITRAGDETPFVID